MPNFQDLPDELVLKVLSYTETKDIVSCGQLSKRIRQISHDGTLWVTANLERKIVKTELLEMILSKGCKILSLSNSTIVGCLRRNMISQLKVLDLSHVSVCPDVACQFCGERCLGNILVLEDLLYSSCSLQHLEMEGVYLTPKMSDSICKNAQTFSSLEFLAMNITPNVEKLNLSHLHVMDDHVKILLRRCNKIKVLNLDATLLTLDSLFTITHYLNLTLEELSLGYCNYKPFKPRLISFESMPRLKILNLYNKKEEDLDEAEIHHLTLLRQCLPYLKIRLFMCPLKDHITHSLPSENLRSNINSLNERK